METQPHQSTSLDALAKYIRDSIQASQDATANALAFALTAGDGLIHARSRIPGGWQQWVREHIGIPLSTARLFTQLAEHRGEIDAEIDRVGMLSLRAARRLISKGGSNHQKTNKPSSDLFTAWNKATPAERTAALARIPIDEFFAVMPMGWREKMAARVAGRRGIGANDPKLSMLLAKALLLVQDANAAGVSATFAESYKQEALATLHRIFSILMAQGMNPADVHVSGGAASSKSHRRAA